ncbi:DNA polymerase [Candidatus Symbiopectobacterium sp.]|uniref:DNA polymerase n=1 Tax=Candidatus Symbiopectobacterium sp. TaxID=2816440 RepID=UPI0025C68ED5|nr:DNA polymerase [Candidatus Symbiopectobacterium sp.]
MPERLYLDLETFSEVPIKNGTHAYTEEAEIMLFAWAIDTDPVQVWDVTRGKPMPTALRTALANPDGLIYAHNSYFDRMVLNHAMPGIAAGGVERWRDTMVRALAHGLPGSLGDLCDILSVSQDKAKDKAGKQLIQLFCKPRPKNSAIRRATAKTHPVEWQRFVEYAGLDIDAMREIDKKLPAWNYSGQELALWHRDQRINDRGVFMDVPLAEAAVTAVDSEQKVLAKRTRELTDNAVQAATQRDAMLKHIAEAFGIELPDMQASTLQRRVNDPDLPFELRELLAIRLQASSTSTSKYKTLMKGVSRDGRLRGTLQFCGASRTGRWAGRLFQPQNLPRPMLKQADIDCGIEALKAGCADLLYDDVMQLTSSALRGCIMAPAGKKLVVSDLSNIEGRVLAWLAGEKWKLQAFRDYDTIIGTDEKGEAIRVGHDLYKLAYAKSFGVHPDEVDKDQRQVGKVQELALGYEGGVGAFLTFSLAYNIDLEEMASAAIANIPRNILDEAIRAYEWSVKQKRTYGLSKRAYVVCDSFKRLWREAHTATFSFWKEIDQATRRAIATPGITISCRKLKLRRDGSWLRIQLPSGRAVCYPGARIDDSGKISYMGINTYSRKWQRLQTYGGKLAENVTQATARDVMAANMPGVEDNGYDIILTVHDEILTEAPDHSDYSHEHLSIRLATNPAWALDLPLSAGGFEAYRYRKE